MKAIKSSLLPDFIAKGLADIEEIHGKTECQKHGPQIGIFHVKKGQEPTCQKCKDEKRSRDDLLKYFKGAIKRSGIPNRFIKSTIGSFIAKTDNEKINKESIKKWLEKLTKGQVDVGFTLMGNVGSGKTHLACAVGKQAIFAGISFSYKTQSNIFNSFDQAKRFSSLVTISEIMTRLSTVGLLVIDECQVAEMTRENTLNFNELIDKRSGNSLPTVFVTNQSGDQFVRSMGSRIISRIGGIRSFLIFDGEDKRPGAFD